MELEAFESERVFEYVAESTPIPTTPIQDNDASATVAFIVIAAILLITLLFCIAVFIDCRQQKLAKMKQIDRVRKKRKLKVATISRPSNTDQEAIVDKMQHETTDPPV